MRRTYFSRNEQKSYLLKLIWDSKKEGMSTGDIMAKYEKDNTLPKAGRKRTDAKRSVVEDLEKLEKIGEIDFHEGRFFSTDCDAEPSEV